MTLERIEGNTLHLSGPTRDYVISADDPMRQRLAHGAVLNMHRAQGITVDRAITVMNSNDRLLNSQSLYYVLQTRAREVMVLHTDNRTMLVEAIEAHRGDVPHASDLALDPNPSGDPSTDGLTSDQKPPQHADNRDAALLGAMSAALTEIVADLHRPQPEMPDALASATSKQAASKSIEPRQHRSEPVRHYPELEIGFDYDMNM